MENREVYIDKMADQLKNWDNELKKLEEKAKMEMNSINKNFRQHVASLKEKEKDVRLKLSELQKSGKDAWEELKPGMQRSLNEFKESVENAIAKFN